MTLIHTTLSTFSLRGKDNRHFITKLRREGWPGGLPTNWPFRNDRNDRSHRSHRNDLSLPCCPRSRTPGHGRARSAMPPCTPPGLAACSPPSSIPCTCIDGPTSPRHSTKKTRDKSHAQKSRASLGSWIGGGGGAKGCEVQTTRSASL